MQAQETLGQYIRRLRTAQGLTGQAVVDAAGISNATLTFYEHDLCLPRPPLLEKVIEFLGGDPDYVWALWLVRAGVQHVTVPQPQDGLPVQERMELENV